LLWQYGIVTPKTLARELSRTLAPLIKETDGALFCPRTSHYSDRVLLGLLSKTITLSQAVSRLVSSGFFGEAFGLARSVVECFLLVKFISNKDTDVRAKSYLDFFKAHIYNAEQIRKKYRLSHMKRPDKQRRGWIKEATQFPNTKVWQAAYNMAFEIYDDPLEINSQTGKGFQAVFDYDAVYELTSHWVHCGSLSLIVGHLPQAGKQFEILDSRGQETEKGYLALHYVAICLLRVCIITFRRFGSEPSARIQGRLYHLMDKLMREIITLQIKSGRVKKSHIAGAKRPTN
jgi:hypothetical protein